jgi:hypothetical protein
MFFAIKMYAFLSFFQVKQPLPGAPQPRGAPRTPKLNSGSIEKFNFYLIYSPTQESKTTKRFVLTLAEEISVNVL